MGVNMEKEIWKDIKGYEGKYQISNTGTLVKYDGAVSSFVEVKPHLDYTKHLRVDLYKNKSRQRTSIHRLVAQAFIPNPLNKKEVDHIDRNPQNNRVENLRWVTRGENMRNVGDRIKGIRVDDKGNHFYYLLTFRNKEEGVKYCLRSKEIKVLQDFADKNKIPYTQDIVFNNLYKKGKGEQKKVYIKNNGITGTALFDTYEQAEKFCKTNGLDINREKKKYKIQVDNKVYEMTYMQFKDKYIRGLGIKPIGIGKLISDLNKCYGYRKFMYKDKR